MLTLADIPSEVIPIIAIGGGVTIALVSIVVNGITGVAKSGAREKSRREIAAYVAEGSITPDEAERLLKAGNPLPGSCGKREG